MLRDGSLMVLVGATFGGAPAVALTRYTESMLMLFGIKLQDAITLTGACGLTISPTALAGFLPGHRAVCIEPMQALRNE